MMKPKFNLKQSQALRKQHEAGTSVGALARKHNCCWKAVARAIKRAGGSLDLLLHWEVSAESSRVRHALARIKQVTLAEKLSKRNNGKLPSPGWLLKNYSGLYNMIRNHPKEFAHIKQSRIRRKFVHTGMSKRPEYRTVQGHHDWIFKSRNLNQRRNYRGMSFFDGWNPDKGGSWGVGAKWIIENLGKKPKDASMHIVNHEEGFMPGNLEWTSSRRQSHQQLHKIVAQLKNRVTFLEKRLKRNGLSIHK